MVEWTCPHCGGKQYSAWDNRDKEKIQCIYCGKEFPNPYYVALKEQPPGAERAQ